MERVWNRRGYIHGCARWKNILGELYVIEWYHYPSEGLLLLPTDQSRLVLVRSILRVVKVER
jgi:hypothetical protein